MRFTLDEQDQQCLDALRQRGRGTIRELCDVFGVTATAVRQRLTRLLEAGLVSRTAERRPGRGRPAFVYGVTEAGLKQLGDNYGDLALILWQELKSIEELDVRQRVEGRVRDAMIGQYRAAVGDGPLPERMRRLHAALTERGFDVEIDDRDGLPILRENHCPYPELASCDSGICTLEQEVFESVLGTPLRLATCCRDGDVCCEFEPVSPGPRGGRLQGDPVLLQ